MLFNNNEKKIKKLRNKIIEVLSLIQNPSDLSAENDILSVFDTMMKKNSKQASSWDKNFDYEYTAYKLIYNTAFDLLCSGRYHIWAGELNPLSPAPNLYRACEKCLDYYILKGTATEHERKEQLNYLHDCIKQL